MLDAVYERLKARLLEHPLTPGQTIQIGPWAEQLRVSSTPVREALARLAAEGLILFTPKKGFFARSPNELEIRGLYAANAALLHAAIEHTAAPAEGISAFSETSSETPNETPHETAWSDLQQSALPLVLATDDLFLRIGRDSGLSELSERIQNLSERLRHVRLVECEVIADGTSALGRMRAHLEAGRQAALHTAVTEYHQARLHRVSLICRGLLVRAFERSG
jgi:DNA-binding transcriptional MocR family regulator